MLCPFLAIRHFCKNSLEVGLKRAANSTNEFENLWKFVLFKQRLKEISELRTIEQILNPHQD